MHNQPRELQPCEDCQEKSIQEFGWTSQGMDWGWGQGIKSHHTQTCQGIWLQLSLGMHDPILRIGIGSDPVIFCGTGIVQTRPIQIRCCAFTTKAIKPHESHKNIIKDHKVFVHYTSSVLRLFHSLIGGTDEYLSHSIQVQVNSSLRCGYLSSSIQHSNCALRLVTAVKLSSRTHSNWGLKLLKEKAQ